MAGPILCVDDDPHRRALYARVARGAGGQPVSAATAAAARAARDGAAIAVAIGGGSEGLTALAELAARRHAAPRIAVAPVDDAAEVVALITRVRPFAIVPAPPDPAALEAQLGAALLCAPGPDGATGRTVAPFDPPDFVRVTVDRATGVLAAPYLRLRLGEEAVRARRYARPLALGLLDVDGLRLLTDEHGPAESAAIVRHVGEVLLRGARTVDLVGRWAAGCFAVLLPETLGDSAWGICERLRAQVAATPVGKRCIRVRLSAGVAVQSRRSRTAVDLSDLIRRADAALWRAKRSGGDRTLALDDAAP
jgi:diguanylate cyclase (GGDEF)-like protein